MCDGITLPRRRSLLGGEVGGDEVPVDKGGEEVGNVGGTARQIRSSSRRLFLAARVDNVGVRVESWIFTRKAAVLSPLE